MAEKLPQSVAFTVPLQAYLASDHVSAATGKTIAITISKNKGAYGNPSAGATNATEIGSGSYYVDLSATDTNTVGPLFVKGTEAATDTIIAIYTVVDANPDFTAAQKTSLNAATPASVGSVTGLTASDVGAIKTQTDKLTFTVANQVDCNIQYVNDVQVKGTGTTANPWNPV
jgi:hypothetical protein